MLKMENSFLPRNRKLKGLSRALRKDATEQENKLWYQFLRTYPIRFQRQKAIGAYIADFYCAKAGLVIELDGGGHYTDEQSQKDALRTAALEQMGLLVLRIPNTDVDRRFGDVCDAIHRVVQERFSLKFHP